jgi:flagellin
MGLRINTNVDAFNAHRNLSRTSGALAKSMEKLSSGFRINRAGDDAAGLGISERMRGQISGVAQAQRNAQDGISLVQSAEGAMQELHSILQRVRELAVQYQNGVYGAAAQLAITTEVAQLSAEVARMIGVAEFNGVKLLDGSGTGTVTLQVGANQGETLTVNLVDLPGATTATNSKSLNDIFTDFDGGTMTTILTDLDEVLDVVSAGRAQMGAIQNRLEYTVNALGVYQENLMAAESRIRDVDMAQEMTNFTKLQILQQSGTAMLAQANQASASVLSLLQ